MSFAPRPADRLRRSAVAVLAVLCLAGTLLAAAPTTASGAPDAAYDTSLSSSSCSLLGRAFVGGSGCSRTKCESGARLYRKTYGAEACQLRNQGDYGFISTIDFRRCTAIGRRWIPQVNYCASYPDRSAAAVYDAPQCVAPRTVYVSSTEADGYYDECLTPDRVRELSLLAALEGSDLTSEASDRSSIQCGYRPQHAFVNGRCVSSPGRLAAAGVAWFGDSLTWRGTDELARLRPTFTLDGEPGRPITALQGQLDYYRSGHGQPTGFVVELGTVPSKSFGKSDLARIIKSLPASTDVMLVMPYSEVRPGHSSPKTIAVGGWMKSIAKSRKKTCTADWPAYVRSHAGLLQDGVHVKHKYEKDWAQWASKQWSRCF